MLEDIIDCESWKVANEATLEASHCKFLVQSAGQRRTSERNRQYVNIEVL